MNEVTQILHAVEQGDVAAGERLLPLAYAELRRIAAQKMISEREGHTLQPTALVHEAYMRLVGPEGEERQWNSRTHFFCAAAEAMRRILIDHARQKGRLKRGGDRQQVTWAETRFGIGPPDDELLAVHEALDQLEVEDPEIARLVKLRYFAGMTIAEAATALDISPRTVTRNWEFARLWLFNKLSASE